MLSVLMSFVLYQWSLGQYVFMHLDGASKFKKCIIISLVFLFPYMIMGILFSLYFEKDRTDVMKKYGIFEVEWNEDVQILLRWAMAALGGMYLIYFMMKITRKG